MCSRILRALPPMSPTTGFICASATRSGSVRMVTPSSMASGAAQPALQALRGPRDQRERADGGPQPPVAEVGLLQPAAEVGHERGERDDPDEGRPGVAPQ